MADKKEQVEIELSLEDYFTLNEAAREEGLLLDEFVEKILRKKLEEEQHGEDSGKQQ